VTLRSLALVLVAALSLACTVPLEPAERLRLSNDTTSPVAVYVNGGWVGTYEAGKTVDVPIRGHGGPPFDVEVRSPSGMVLSEITLTAEDVRQVADGSMSMATGGAVPCGWIDLAYGDDARPNDDDPTAPKPTAGGVCP
jgi:hypothetical protein